ncbi:limulus clotting factor C-like [Rhynchophorus ferrugineus]|uniref:limulus clotting factor C-like n=1 Tax=Rhynchophorus ferrugineus TaxID=354439 RepID=UPI003FCDE420
MTAVLLSRFIIVLVTCCLVSNIYGLLSTISPLNLTRIKREDIKGVGDTCNTPPLPANGQWTVLRSNRTYIPGQRVDKLTTLSVTCNDGYILSTYEPFYIMICLGEGKWHPEMPQCEKLCPPVKSTSTLNVTCSNIKTGNTVPCDKASNYARLDYACLPYYELNYLKSAIYCIDGSWSSPIPECSPICGEKRIEQQHLTTTGKQAPHGSYPWTAAIFSKKAYETNSLNISICGGSLLTPSLILTAAHCVTSAETGRVRNMNDYIVAVGHYYNNYKDQRDEATAQYSKVSHIEVQTNYGGYQQNFRFDIAILKLESPFTITEAVQPVCITDINDFHLGLSTGVVTGWNLISNVVVELETSFHNRKACSAALDKDFTSLYFTNDKICGKYNGEKDNVLCKGFSGAGMAFKHPQTGRFFIYGVVSVVSIDKNDRTNPCTKSKFFLSTGVAFFNEWLLYNIHLLSRSDS